MDTEEARLKALFGEVGEIQTMPGDSCDSVCTLIPQVFRMRIQDEEDSNVLKACLLPLQAEGPDTDTSLWRLYEDATKGSGIYLYRFRPKPGQAPDLIRAYHPYRLINRKDPEHDHSNPDLADLLLIYIQHGMINSTFHRIDFEQSHAHLLID